MATSAPIRTFFSAENRRPIPGSVVGFRRSGGASRREDLWPVVHPGEEVFVRGGEPDEPVVGHREPGQRAGGGEDGVEGDRRVLVFTWDGALFGAICDALSAAVGRRSPPGDAAAGVLLVHRGAECGELGLGVDYWSF